MSERNTLAKIKAVLGMDLKLEQMTLDNGAILEAEVFEAGQEVFIVTDDEKIALPVGEYKMEDGRILVIAEEGIIAEIKEEVAEEEKEAEPDAEVEAEAENVTPKKIVESITKEQFFTEVERLETMIKELQPKEELSAEPKEEVTEDPKVELEEIKHSPEAQVEKKQTFAKFNNRPQTTEQVVFNKLFNK
jgi:hypothetical protein